LYTLNCNGKLIDLTTPKVMGIINVTPDSFYDGGKTVTTEEITNLASKMLSEGATFLDVGGYSSRPGAIEISETEELKRVIPAIETLTTEFPEAIISVDTFRSIVAKEAIQTGAAMVNDISGGEMDSEMFSTIAQLQIPYILMHMRGTPQTMYAHTDYDNVTREVLLYISERIALARKAGINDIIADPGFGFSKTHEQNFELLNELELFKQLEIPFLIGISRKSMICRTLMVAPNEALNGTTALHAIALFKGGSIIRTHDVKEALECITLIENLKGLPNF
jgi:dihydropteroate synthase